MNKFILFCLLILSFDALGLTPIEQPPRPVSFNLQGPDPAAAVPRSAKFFGSTSGEQGTFTELQASLIFSTGEIQELSFELTHCGAFEPCTLMLDPGLLPANTDFTLFIVGPGEPQEWNFSTNEVIDDEPPVVENLTLDQFSVAVPTTSTVTRTQSFYSVSSPSPP